MHGCAALDAHPVQGIDHLRDRGCQCRMQRFEAIRGIPELLPKRRMWHHSRRGGRLGQQLAGRVPHLHQHWVGGFRCRDTVEARFVSVRAACGVDAGSWADHLSWHYGTRGLLSV